MMNFKGKKLKAESYSKSQTRKMMMSFESPLALGLCSTVPTANDPIEAILWHARLLTIESGLNGPPYPPAAYAHLRKVKEIIHRPMEVEGRLLPCPGGFTIELRQDRSHERMNFTCAHELGHTFFYEAVPSIKYRIINSSEPHHDKEEEMLCNIAAAELLMPANLFSDVVKDYSASPQALEEISQIFEASIVATTVRILSLNLWDAEFILWQNKGKELRATWYSKPNHSLKYYPGLEIQNQGSSGVYHSLTTGEATASFEWLRLNGEYRPCCMQSLRLKNSRAVLSCISNISEQRPAHFSHRKVATAELPLDYTCECDGTGWRRTEKQGRSYVARCLAPQHRPIN